MKPNEPSRTALMIARQRAAHQVLDHGSILHDTFAMKILREDEKDVLQFANGHPLASIGRLFTAARSRIAEDALLRAVERGIRQIAILGAGLDTFALRNPHGARQIRIYEVDHPATQAWKRQRLAEAQIALPPWLILVPVDFERDDVGEKLVAAGFQQNSPAFFTWLGVVPYLTQDAIGRTLDCILSIQNSEVVFDYMEPPEAFSEELRQLETERTEHIKKIDERSVSRFEPAGIAAILRSHGFGVIEDINFQEIASRFGRAVQGLAPGHAGVHVVHAKHELNAVIDWLAHPLGFRSPPSRSELWVPRRSRSWRRACPKPVEGAGTANAYATGFVQNGQKLRRQHRRPPLRQAQGRLLQKTQGCGSPRRWKWCTQKIVKGGPAAAGDQRR
jgi:methyltransferase (TIGR00027 family)